MIRTFIKLKYDPQPIGNLIEETLQRMKLKSGLKRGEVINSWREIVGKKIADKAIPISLKNGCLLLKTESSAWSQELSFMDEELMEKVNKHAGEKLVNKIRFKTK